MLILFSGLAADEQVFTPQKLAFPELIVPPWLVPEPNETLDHYAQRMADQLPLATGTRVTEPCWIGGASFGGILALHMARYLQPAGVILLGSVRAPDQLPRYARLARPLRPLVPYMPIRPWQWLVAPVIMWLTKGRWPRLHGLAGQMRRADPRVIRWSISRILDWQHAPAVACPVYHIHGGRDHVLPARYTHPDHVIQQGGHIISLTHPEEVTDFIRRVLDNRQHHCERGNQA
ncbi:MAG: alpha/beta hydrolase [Pirellulaceae bacterium]|nr:alpha/beta hydrolase [Pirellulaceae bacterium]